MNQRGEQLQGREKIEDAIVFKEGDILDGVPFGDSAEVPNPHIGKFVQTPDGKWRNSVIGRKLIELRNSRSVVINPRRTYRVEIVRDTDPERPNKGKYIAEIIEVSDRGMEIPSDLREHLGTLESGIAPIEFNPEHGTLLVLDVEIPVNPDPGTRIPSLKKFEYFTWDQRTVALLRDIAQAVKHRFPMLLTGDTATSKTSSIEYLAMLTRHDVYTVNVGVDTTVADLLGKFVPADEQARLRFDELLKSRANLTEASQQIIQRIADEGRDITLVESQKIAANEGISVETQEWVWQDGPVVKAMKEGAWLILDEINLAPQAVRERLNSVVSPHPEVTLQENGGIKIGAGGDVALDERFRMFATKNPEAGQFFGRMPMSLAEANRYQYDVQVAKPDSKGFHEMMRLAVCGEQPLVEDGGHTYGKVTRSASFDRLSRLDGLDAFLQKIAVAHHALEGKSVHGELRDGGKTRKPFTRRDLMSLLSFINDAEFVDRFRGERVTVERDPERVILRALEMKYLRPFDHHAGCKKVVEGVLRDNDLVAGRNLFRQIRAK